MLKWTVCETRQRRETILREWTSFVASVNGIGIGALPSATPGGLRLIGDEEAAACSVPEEAAAVRRARHQAATHLIREEALAARLMREQEVARLARDEVVARQARDKAAARLIREEPATRGEIAGIDLCEVSVHAPADSSDRLQPESSRESTSPNGPTQPDVVGREDAPTLGDALKATAESQRAKPSVPHSMRIPKTTQQPSSLHLRGSGPGATIPMIGRSPSPDRRKNCVNHNSMTHAFRSAIMGIKCHPRRPCGRLSTGIVSSVRRSWPCLEPRGQPASWCGKRASVADFERDLGFGPDSDTGLKSVSRREMHSTTNSSR